MKESKYFGNDIEVIEGKKWNWSKFSNTKNYPIPKALLDWVIGQDHALDECSLCLDEWAHKLTYLQKEEWYKPWSHPDNIKPTAKQTPPPGPYMLLLGDPGTGKSLMGRAMAEQLTKIYKEHNIKMLDTMAWGNREIPSEPKISIHPSPNGSRIVNMLRKKALKSGRFTKWAFRILQAGMIGFGTLIIGFLSYFLINKWIFPNPNIMYNSYGQLIIVENIAEALKTGLITFQTYWASNGGFIGYIVNGIMANAMMFYLGLGALSMGAMLFIFKNLIGRLGGSSKKGIGGAESISSPKLIVNNSNKKAQFIDATGHSSSQLFGSIAWDPYQTGGLGTPEHQRVTAGDVHRANMGILYIDEIKNLMPLEAVTLLTVLEDGQLAITMRGNLQGGNTSAMAVSTEPVPCMVFLIAAGNFDSIGQLHPALMNRIEGYGKVVRMSNDMPNTLSNRRKYVQFIAQESNRFRMPPFTKRACMKLVDEGRRRSNRRAKLTTKFRPLISIIKTAGTLALNDKSKTTKEVHVIEAITEHCKSIQSQRLEQYVEDSKLLTEMEPKGSKMGVIHGLYVLSDSLSGDKVGSVGRVIGQLIKPSSKSKQEGYFKVTGVKEKDAKWIQGSIAKVRSVILKKYRKDVAMDYCTHIDFSQSHNVDGPSAGVTMTLLLCSLLEDKPIKQNVAVTGEINISQTDEIIITAVGGLHHKIMAAQKLGFKKVVIPYKNYKHSIDPADYTIKVVGAKTLSDYLKEVLSN